MPLFYNNPGYNSQGYNNAWFGNARSYAGGRGGANSHINRQLNGANGFINPQLNGANGFINPQLNGANRNLWHRFEPRAARQNAPARAAAPPAFNPPGAGVPAPGEGAAQTDAGVFNKPLPDGVQMFPLNAENMQNIQKLGLGEGAAVPAAKPDSEGNAFAAGLKEIIQNERNGVLFYNGLSNAAPSERFAALLKRVGDGCEKGGALLNKLYGRIAGEPFSPEERAVADTLSFADGVRLAIEEESMALRQIADIFCETSDAALARALSAQMARKTSDLSLLGLMLG